MEQSSDTVTKAKIDPKDKVIQIARYFVHQNDKDKKGLSPLKLQKLLYYAQVWNLVKLGRPIFKDDIQAWVHGPAIPHVWGSFRDYNFSIEHPEITDEMFGSLLPEEKEVLDMVWNVYGKYDGKYLEMLSHNEEPWQEARRGIETEVPSRNIISPDTMKSYYEQRLKEAQ